MADYINEVRQIAKHLGSIASELKQMNQRQAERERQRAADRANGRIY
jgi:hypothetical protein